MRAQLVATLLSVAVVTACGSVAGNPKRPRDPATPAPGSLRYELPAIALDVGEESFEVEAASGLTGSALVDGPVPFGGGPGDRAALRAFGRRLIRLVGQADLVSTRITSFAAEADAADAAGVQRFAGKGPGGLVSGRIGPATTEGYEHEAVLCLESRVIRVFRWRADGALELYQDYAAATAADDPTFALVSRIRARTVDGARVVDLATTGQWDDGGAAGAERGLVERIHAEKDANGVRVRMVQDRFTGDVPSPLAGDAWLVARLLGASGVRRPTFVGFDRAVPRALCQAGFDEAAADLWEPRLDGPKFCAGVAADGKPLPSFEAFRALVASHQDIGVAKSSELEVVAMPAGIGCD